jgi:hypothetical protein
MPVGHCVLLCKEDYMKKEFSDGVIASDSKKLWICRGQFRRIHTYYQLIPENSRVNTMPSTPQSAYGARAISRLSIHSA